MNLLLGVDATEEDRVIMKAYLGLDKPLYIQYGIFVSRAVMGDFGKSIIKKRPVSELVWVCFPATLQLGGIATIISLLISLPLGVYAAVRRDTWFDWAARMLAVLGQSIPTFWLGIILIIFFSVWLKILPAGGRGGLLTLILPVITLGYYTVAGIMRLMRSSMLDVLDNEYIKLARVKGLPERAVIWKHAFKNALLPVLTFFVIVFVQLLGGAVVTETIFAWPGVGRLVVEGVICRDFPIVQAIVLILATMYLMGNLMVDILYAYLNPKIRYGR